MNKEEIIDVLARNLGMKDYVDVTKYITDLEIENKYRKEEIQGLQELYVNMALEFNKSEEKLDKIKLAVSKPWYISDMELAGYIKRIIEIEKEDEKDGK